MYLHANRLCRSGDGSKHGVGLKLSFGQKDERKIEFNTKTVEGVCGEVWWRISNAVGQLPFQIYG